MKRYLKTPEEVIQALKEGKVVETKINNYKLIDGIICGFRKQDGQWMLGHSIYEEPYIDEPEPLKLEVGKFYKTRAGKKAWIVYASKDTHDYYPFCCIVLGGNEVYYVNEQGFVVSTETSELDLVAHWED